MCLLCTQLWTEEHWAETAGGGSSAASNVVALETHAVRRGERLRARNRRSRLFNLILAQRGLSLQDWEGSRYILRDRKGRTAIISSLAGVWREAERLSGSPLDPLDAGLLQTVKDLADISKPEP